MPYNALEWHVSVQMNVTKAGFSVSYIVLHTCGQPVPQRLISANVDNGTAAGIKRLRRLQTDRLRRAPGKGPLACRLLLPGCCFHAISMFVAIPWASKTNHTRGGARFEHRNFRDIGLQPGSSCKSPDSQYATTDMCSSTPAVRCRRNEGTCTQTYAHKYLWQGLHCQVICTKWPNHRLNDSSTLGSQVLLYQRQHRRRNKCPPAAKVQQLRGARLKALLALDFCLRILGCSCKSPGRAICHYGYVQEYTGFPYP